MIKRLIITDSQNNKRELKDFFDQEVATLLEWEYRHEKVKYQLENSNKFLTALSPSKNEVITLQSDNGTMTDTLKVINGDGTIKFNLKPPKLNSVRYKMFADKVSEREALRSLRFIQLGEKINNTTIAVWIGFDWDWFEIKELNLMTGEFGVTKMTGRL